MDIFTSEGKSLKVDINKEEKLYSLGANTSFYANLSANSNEEIFSVSLEGAFVSPGFMEQSKVRLFVTYQKSGRV